MRHPFLSRVNDSTAFAFGHTESVDGNDEQVTEVYYKFAFNDHFAITPLFQAVFDPVGSEGSDIVTTGGCKNTDRILILNHKYRDTKENR